MPYTFSNAQLAVLTDFADAENWSGFYQTIYEFTGSPDGNGETADPYVREWFRVAAQTNAGADTPASNLIRDYTAAQVSIRLGETVSVGTMDQASDAIARSIWDRYVSNGGLPTLEGIREEDAGRAVEALRNAGHEVDQSVWSGNILMVGLGDMQPFHNEILDPTSGYNLVVAGQALAAAGYTTIALTFLGSVWSGSTDTGAIATAASEVVDYVTGLYGWFGASPGMSLVDLEFPGFVAGREGSFIDTLEGTVAGNYIHGGAGNDMLVGSFGYDVLDGGDDHDIADFSSFTFTLEFAVPEQTVSGSVAYSGTVMGFDASSGFEAYSTLYDIEELISGQLNDVFHIGLETPVQRIDAGGGSDDLVLSEAQQAAQVNLATGAFTCGANQIEIVSIENVAGTDFSDKITGSGVANNLVGLAGHDTIVGGAGADTILGGDGNDSIDGGDGADLLYGHAGDDFIFAGAGADTIYGGDGADTIYGNGSCQIHPGAGMDVLYIEHGDTVSPMALELQDTVYYEGQALVAVAFDGTQTEPPILYSYHGTQLYYWMEAGVGVA